MTPLAWLPCVPSVPSWPVLILGIAYSPGESSYTAAFLPDIQDSVELWDLFMVGLPRLF